MVKIGELLRRMMVLLSITSIALASLHGEEEEQDILAVIDISLSLSFSSCDDINCDNGGSCFKGNCVCPDKTTGMYCEVLENPCEPNPCYANGNCSETEEGYMCECPRDFFGTNCNVIQSPNYPDNYANNTDMTWVLSGIPDKYIQLQFDDVFQIEDGNCGVVDYLVAFGCTDFITIRSGGYDLEVEYCGGARPSPITAPKGSDVWIVFRSNSQCSYSGFKLNYGYIDTSFPTNQIASWNYPDNYNTSMYVTWLISGIPDKYILLQFEDVFEMEDYSVTSCGNVSYNSVSRDCYDYIKIITGDINVIYCGGAPPSPITAQEGSDVLIVFSSDNACSKSGFKLNYTHIDTSFPTNPIASWNYPDNYNINMYVTWVISGIPDKYILLQFEDVFEIEDTSVRSCGTVTDNSVFNVCIDYIQIITGDINVKYCGGAPPSPITTQEGSDVSIFFMSDDSCSYSGFKLNYTHIDHPIPPVNPIISPSYPNEYPANTFLTWLVPGRHGFNISFTFNGVFGVEDDDSCNFDYVMVYTNDKYCGDVKPQPIVVPTGEDAMVIFKTGRFNGFQGFNLTYEYQETDNA